MSVSDSDDVHHALEVAYDRSLIVVGLVLSASALLFGFLTFTAFSTRGSTLDSAPEAVAFCTAFFASGLSIVLLLGRGIHLAVHWTSGQKFHVTEASLRTSGVNIIAASLLMGLSLVSVVYFVSEVFFGTAMSVGIVVITIVVGAWSWFWPHHKQGKNS
jgi:hypothetical protein